MAPGDRTLKKGESYRTDDLTGWGEYEMAGDTALADHKGKKALRFYEKAMQAYNQFRREDNIGWLGGALINVRKVSTQKITIELRKNTIESPHPYQEKENIFPE